MQEILQMASVFDGSLLKSFKQKWQDIHKKTQELWSYMKGK